MANNDNLLQQRQGLVRVYMPNRSTNYAQFLNHAVFIVGQHFNSPNLLPRIVTHVANHFRRDPDVFTINPVDSDFGDFILVCPSPFVCELVAQSNPYFESEKYQILVIHFFQQPTSMNFDFLRIFIACHHTSNIPRFIHLTDDPFGTVIEVVLVGWIRVIQGALLSPPPPNNDVMIAINWTGDSMSHGIIITNRTLLRHSHISTLLTTMLPTH
jgi:hypothetical protein